MNESNKLNGSHYSNWKFKLEKLLEGENAWVIASGDELKPTIATGRTTTTTIRDWEKRENKEKLLLKLSVKDCIITHVRECKSTNDMWTTLEDLYEIKNTNHLLFPKGNILSIKMEDNESVAMLISRIKDLIDKLGNIGEIVSNIDLVTITMNGMNDDYHIFITCLNAREKALKFKELTGILMQEEERQVTLKPQSSDLSLIAKKKPFRGKASAG